VCLSSLSSVSARPMCLSSVLSLSKTYVFYLLCPQSQQDLCVYLLSSVSARPMCLSSVLSLSKTYVFIFCPQSVLHLFMHRFCYKKIILRNWMFKNNIETGVILRTIRPRSWSASISEQWRSFPVVVMSRRILILIHTSCSFVTFPQQLLFLHKF
jgi:hypothetical protein